MVVNGDWKFYVYTNHNGLFDLREEPMGSGNYMFEASVALCDIDNDGDLDMATAGEASPTSTASFIIYRNDGSKFTNIQEPMGTNEGLFQFPLRTPQRSQQGSVRSSLYANLCIITSHILQPLDS